MPNDGGMVRGTFTTDQEAIPRQGDNGTLWYSLVDWDVTIAASVIHPALHFSRAGATDTAAMCIGLCVQGSPSVEHLYVDNGAVGKDGSQRLQLEWLLPDGVTLPAQLTDWGASYLPGCWLRSQYIPGITNTYIGFREMPMVHESAGPMEPPA